MAMTTASATAAQILSPQSCHATPMMIEVSPTMEPAWISIPPVIMTSVTKIPMIPIGTKSFMLRNIDETFRNFGLVMPKMRISTRMTAIRNQFQFSFTFSLFLFSLETFPLIMHSLLPPPYHPVFLPAVFHVLTSFWNGSA